MLTKQWLREYLSINYTTPRELARIRQYRQTGLTKWRVPHIIAFLSLLLQFALILFLVGLVNLLWTVDWVVATFATIPTALWLLSYCVTTCAPTFFPHCPYKSPQAKALHAICHFFRIIIGYFRTLYNRRFSSGYLPAPRFLLVADTNEDIIHTWSWDENFEKETRQRSELDVDAIVSADITFVDDEFLEKTIKVCARDFSLSDVVQLLRRLLAYRLKHTPMSLGKHRTELWRLGDQGIAAVVQIAVEALSRTADDFHGVGVSASSPWVGELVDFLSAALVHLKWYRQRLTATSREVVELLLRLVTTHTEPIAGKAFMGLIPLLSDPRSTPLIPIITSAEGK